MRRFISVEVAKEEIKRLEHYIQLFENYETPTWEKVAILEYARTGSVVGAIKNMYKRKIIKDDGELVTKSDVIEVIKRKSKDELHKIVRSGYMQKTKHIRG